VYPGADGELVLYEDDGVSFDFRRGAFTEIRIEWNNRARELTIAGQHGAAAPREFLLRAPGGEPRRITFRGSRLKVRL
jgi:alpha-D-xyloside xylohydrolase